MLYTVLIFPICITSPAHLILLYLITLIIFDEAHHHAVFSILLPLPLRSKYSSQHPVLKHPEARMKHSQSMLNLCGKKDLENLEKLCIYIQNKSIILIIIFIYGTNNNNICGIFN
jgi:hypothetical protein